MLPEPALPTVDLQITWMKAGHVGADLRDGLGLLRTLGALKNYSAEIQTTSQRGRGRPRSCAEANLWSRLTKHLHR